MYRRTPLLSFCIVSTVLWAAAADVARAEEPYAVQLTMRDGRFDPETLDVPAGRRVKIVFHNEGPGIEEFHSDDLRQEKVVPPGKSQAFVLTPLKPGVYRFIGEFHPDTAQGRVVAR